MRMHFKRLSNRWLSCAVTKTNYVRFGEEKTIISRLFNETRNGNVKHRGAGEGREWGVWVASPDRRLVRFLTHGFQ